MKALRLTPVATSLPSSGGEGKEERWPFSAEVKPRPRTHRFLFVLVLVLESRNEEVDRDDESENQDDREPQPNNPWVNCMSTGRGGSR